MAIVSYGLEPGYPETEESLQGSRVVRSKSYRLIILVNDEDEEGDTILNQLPTNLSVGFDLGGGFTIRKRKIKRSAEARKKHILDIQADDQVTEEDKQDKDKPPDERRAKWSWDFETLEVALTQDVDGNAVQTTAGDPIEVTTPIAIAVLTVEKQLLTFDPNTIINYMNTVNASDFWGAPAGSALLAGIRDHEGVVYNDVRYRAVGYTIKFLLPDIPGVINGWNLLLVNHGPNYIVNGEVTAIKDESGSKITRNIAATGTSLIDPGDPPYILTFKQFKDADFSALGIDWPL